MRDINKILESLSPEKRALLEKKLKEKAANYNAFPLSYQQKRLWFLDQLEPGNLSYNIPLAIKLTGKLDTEKVIEANNIIVKRHEILRSNIVVVNENPILTIKKKNSLDYSIIDISQLNDAKKEDKLNKLLNENLNKYFHLNSDQLFFIQLIKLNDNKHVLQVVMHHIISDGWSLGLFTKEFTTIYTSLIKHEDPELEELKIQYTDYAKWQNEWSESDNFKSQLKYWKEKFKELPPKLNLPYDIKNSKNLSNAGIESIKFKQDEVKIIKSFLTANKITGFIFFITILKILLQKVCRENDISIGTPIANRNRKEIENLIGFFVNTLVLRTQIDSDNTFEQLLQTEKRNILEAFDNQDLPFEYLVESINPERDMDSTPLFQVMFVYQNIGKNLLTLDDLEIEPIEQSNATVKFDLTFNISESENDFVLSAQYNKNKFSQNIISTLLNSYYALIRNIISNPLKLIKDVSLYYDLNYSNLSYIPQKINLNPSSRLEELFQRSVNNYGESIALKSDNSILTYNELNILSNKLANYLLQNGILPNQLIGIHLERDINIIVSIIAIFKIGAAYLPLDPIYPSDRINYMIMDSGVQFIISNNSYSSNINSNSKIIDIDAVLSDNKLSSKFDHKIEKSINNIAYVIYTSGSTGKPKGTVVTQYNILRLFESCEKLFSFNNKDVWTLFHSYSFDFSVWEIWGALLHGSKLLVILQNISRQPDEFYRICKKEGVTVLNQTPSAFSQFMSVDSQYSKDDSISTLRYVIFGGEALKFSSLLPWLVNHDIEKPELINMYGITETTVHVTYKKITKEEILSETGSNIGIPLPDLEISVFDEGLHPLPIGFTGEICVAGGGVASGYLNRDTLTKEKFINNPITISNCKRLYRSGDLGVINRNGELIYLGRIDKQIQLRGFRIELGEIEDVLNKVEFVNNSVVTPYYENDELKYLVAYLTTSKNISSEEIKKSISTSVPEYMIPNYFIVIDKLPLTENGKVDYAKLPKLSFTRTEKKDIVSASTETEKLLVEVWKNLLSVNLVSIDDNFFNLGGHSLLATKMVARIQKSLNVNIPLRLVFENPILKDFARVIDNYMNNTEITDSIEIEKVSRENDLKLSYQQQRLWFLNELEPGNPNYNIPVAFKIKGKIDKDKLSKSISEVIQRHEILRTIIKTIEGKPYLFINEKNTYSLETIDLSNLKSDERKRRIEKLTTKVALETFYLDKWPLFKIVLLNLGNNEFIILLTMHHIISDGWSMNVMIRELIENYNGIKNNGDWSREPLDFHYIDYAHWQREWIKTNEFKSKLNFWIDTLKDSNNIINLPTDFTRPKNQSYHGKHKSFIISSRINDKIEHIANLYDATLFMTYLTAFYILLNKYTRQNDINIGTPILNRTQTGTEKLIGFFANTLVLRSNINSDNNFVEQLNTVRNICLNAYENQDVPFEMIVDKLEIERDLSYTPLFQVMFIMQEQMNNNLRISDIEVNSLEVENNISQFDLTLSIAKSGSGSNGSIEYNTDLFEDSAIVELINRFLNLLNTICENPRKKIKNISILTNKEKDEILSYSKGKSADYKNVNIIDIFQKQVPHFANQIAIRTHNDSITYAQLNIRSNKFANYLIKKGVKPESIIGISLDRSINLIVSIIGILKAGCAFLPIDTKYPIDRIKYIVENSKLHLIVTNESYKHLFNDFIDKLVLIDSKLAEINSEDDGLVSIYRHPYQLAYIIYTSGSTGIPKGVSIQDSSLTNYILYAREKFKLKNNDRVLQFSSISFDTALEEIFPTLISGAELVLRDDFMIGSISTFIDEIKKLGITILDLPTAFWNQLVQDIDQNKLEFSELIKLVIIGGEKVNRSEIKIWQKILSQVRLLNTYGPTEATIVSTDWELTNLEIKNNVPIGKPISNVKTYVLDEHGELLPNGIPGELCIGGVGVARGYLDNAKLTAEKFIPNPYGKTGGERLYRTGDLVRYLPDGDIEYISRIDNQVKLRGFRIELGEIEEVLNKYGGIKQAVVIIREDKSNNKKLVAYFVSGKSEIKNEELEKYLSEKLPEYMVPSFFVKLDKIPLTPNSKIDRKALPLPTKSDVVSLEEFIAPGTEKEKLLAEVWQDVLGINEVGINDNFFKLGGDSIVAIQMIAKAKQKGLQINPVQIFQNQTLQKLAMVAKEVDIVVAEQGLVEGTAPLTPIQQYFFENNFKNPNHWNQSIFLKVNDSLNEEKLKEAVRILLNHHDELRATFEYNKDKWQQNIKEPPEEIPFEVVDLTATNSDSVKQMVEEYNKKYQASLDIETGPVIKVIFYKISDIESRILFIVHHLVIDGISWRILIEDMITAYNLLLINKKVTLPSKSTSFKTWAEFINEFVSSEKILNEKDYWVKQADKKIDRIEKDFDEKDNLEKSLFNQSTILSKEETNYLLKDIHEKYNTQINDILLTGLLLAYNKWKGKRQLLLHLEGHGREQLSQEYDVSRTIGWFTALFPVYLNMKDAVELSEIIKSVKEDLRKIPNKGIGFGMLRYLLNDEALKNKFKIFDEAQITFNYLGQFDQSVPENSPFVMAAESKGADRGLENKRTSLIDVTAVVSQGEMSVSISANKNQFQPESIIEFLTLYKKSLQEIINHCKGNDNVEYTSSDFDLIDLEDDQLNSVLDKLNNQDN